MRLADNGARHRPPDIGGGPPRLSLGQRIDYELDGQSSSGNGDDSAGLADEGGVRFLDPLRRGNMARVRVTVTGSVPGYFTGWFDFDANGSWQEAGERIFSDLVVTPGTHDFSFLVPTTAATGATYARFRLSTVAGLSQMGAAPDGEVEDYRVIVSNPKPPVFSSLDTEHQRLAPPHDKSSASRNGLESPADVNRGRPLHGDSCPRDHARSPRSTVDVAPWSNSTVASTSWTAATVAGGPRAGREVDGMCGLGV